MDNREINSDRIMQNIQKYIEKGSSYMDAVLEYANNEELEVELLGEIIKKSPILKSKISDEAEKLKMIEPTAKLPLDETI